MGQEGDGARDGVELPAQHALPVGPLGIALSQLLRGGRLLARGGVP